MDDNKTNPKAVGQEGVENHHEEHQEEAEWHQKGGDSSLSWHRVMKVTKKTERSSKTEQCTKTYKVIGSGDQKRIIEMNESNNEEESNKAPKLKEDDDSNLNTSHCGAKNPFEEKDGIEDGTNNEEMKGKETEDKDCKDVGKKKKKCCGDCCGGKCAIS